jgi:hypothetical protein
MWAPNSNSSAMTRLGVARFRARVPLAHRIDVSFLVDLDGDGVDEVVLTTDYFESAGFPYLAVWNGRRYVAPQLAGDGG